MRESCWPRGGFDPLDHKRAQSASFVTFRQVAELYLAAHRPGWRSERHARAWEQSLRDMIPVLGDRAIEAVDVAAVMRVLELMRRLVPETASRVRARIEAVLDFASARGWRSSENCARWRGHLANLLPASRKVAAVRHYRAMPFAEVPAFIRELRRLEGIPARALEFCILTATRTAETLGATWMEFESQETKPLPPMDHPS